MPLVRAASPVVSKMRFISSGCIWIHTLLFVFLQCWGRLLASTSSTPLLAPELSIYSRSEDSVVLVCQAPIGHQGIHFMLYDNTKKVDSQQLPTSLDKVHFTVRTIKDDSVQSGLFCCVYKDLENRFSAFSPYLELQLQRNSVPTRSTPPLPAPFLSVQPSTGMVKRGDMITFSCLIASPLPQNHRPASNSKPMTFVLLRTAGETGQTSVIPAPPARQVSNLEPLPGVFSVGPVRGQEEEGEYTCLYQVSKEREQINSTVSNKVRISITDMLPPPTLLLLQQDDVWRLQCTGFPLYPGAVFSLYLADSEHSVTTQNAAEIHHQVTFPVLVQDTPFALYQCQYSIHVQGILRSSERSPPLAVAKGGSSNLTLDKPNVDWPLILGSLSAVVLFLTSVIVIAVVLHRKVKATAKEKNERQDAKFWTNTHDPIVGEHMSRHFASQKHERKGWLS
ncbi:uncharacterized protein LOC142899625 isoform X4 [Nelusetta ayraudi]|uniref:uncharacterized protein LOC142899625 isoform X4 n=1 Tax=Nelusetta ayraudi TaxID=303726 RepID=UPI003F711604